MTSRTFSFAVLLSAILSGLSTAQPSPASASQDLTPNSNVILVSELSTLRPGTTTTVAFRVTMDDGWHTYWTNPGDAGLPLTAQWTLPTGVTISALRFPVPRLMPQPPLMSFGYEHEVLVLADLTVAANVPVGTSLVVAADVDFLVCAAVCLPASARVELTARVASLASPTRWSAAIGATRAALPRSTASWSASALRDGAHVFMSLRALELVGRTPGSFFFIPDSSSVLEHAVPQRVLLRGDSLRLSLTAAKRLADTASRLRGVLLAELDGVGVGYHLDVAMAKASPKQSARLLAALNGDQAISAGGVAATSSAASGDTSQMAVGDVPADNSAASNIGLWFALLLAFAGGLILNLMPCVFPVLSIKILAFVERGGGTSRESAAVGRRHALVFTFGVLTTFWALAGALIALRAGGAQLGWGFQLQSPAVVAVLALVVFVLALNLSGLFTVGASLTRLGGVGTGERYSDSFLTGLLAVIVATPCTAPFMGAALGYALTQHALIGLAVFTALGLGLAAPYIIFASSPALLRALPKPGPWLETLKQLLAFPLFATVVWLLWVLGRQAGPDQVAVTMIFGVALSLAAWIAGRAQMAGRTRSGAVAVFALVMAIGAGGLVIAAQPVVPSISRVTPAGWETWSAARVTSARDSGRVVFVDYTAAWCLSCQVNERVALHTDAVERAFAEGNVLLLRADWTSRDADISAALAAFGRSGVPLYALYPADRTKPPELLPAVLTPGVVLRALKRAVGSDVASRNF